MKAFVLTYHSGNLSGNEYANNNLVALAQDLEHLRALRVPIVPLRHVVDALRFDATDKLPEKVAVITLDDGLDFDFIDLVHPFHGKQTSVHTLFQRFAGRYSVRPHATTFVIASPIARQQIAKIEMLDHQWIGDHWWAAAVASGFFHVGNHSWDHVSPSVSREGQRERTVGAFTHVDTFDDAELQVRVAREYIEAKASNPGSCILGYPYGLASDYLVKDYLPMHAKRHGTVAAVTSMPGVLHEGSNRWLLPRFTCGADWRSPEEFARIFTN